MKYILFYFIAAIRTTGTFSCKTCRWAGSPAVYHTVACCYTKTMNAACWHVLIDSC